MGHPSIAQSPPPTAYSPFALRTSAIAGILAVVLVVAGGIVGPQIVAGERVSGTSDSNAIRAYYSHEALDILQLVILPAAALILVLAVGLYSVSSGGPARALATCGLAFTAAIVPGYLVAVSLQSALVSAASSGGDIVPLFRLWDVFYNSGLYTLEASYVLAFTLALAKSATFPKWFRPFGIVVASLQAANVFAIWIGVPDAATVPGNVGMLSWLLAASVLLFRVSAQKSAS